VSIAEKFRTSRELMASALKVMRRHPRLLLFPLVSGGGTLAMAVFFLVPPGWLLVSEIWWTPPDWEAVGRQAQGLGKEAAFDGFVQGLAGGFYAYGVLIYLVSLVMAAFFNVAFYHEILRALGGDAVSLRGGLRFAWGRRSAILRWSLLAGTVGAAIRAVEERLGWVGRIVVGLVGTAWSVAAIFAIPVIVRSEERNPFAVLRHSAAMLKRTWGESVAGFVGIQVLGVVLVAAVTAAAALAAVSSAGVRLHGLTAGIVGGWLLALAAIGVGCSVATHVYRGALYVYASEGVIPAEFSRDQLDAGWSTSKG